MPHINLLPWREQHRQHQKQQYLMGLFATAVVVALIFWFIGSYIDTLIDNQNGRNDYIQKEIAILDAQIAQIKSIKENKQAIEQRMALIEQLQASRNIAPQILDELARVVPPGISFISMSRQQNRIQVVGISESNNRLADFMRRLDNSKVFNQGVLSSIVADTSAADAVSEFKINFTINPGLAMEINPVAQQTSTGAGQ